MYILFLLFWAKYDQSKTPIPTAVTPIITHVYIVVDDAKSSDVLVVAVLVVV